MKEGTGVIERQWCPHPAACAAGSIDMTGSTPQAAPCGWKASQLTLTQSYNMIVPDCAEGGKHEDRDCDRTGEEFQGDV
jgi:hypothetical protein